MNDTPSKFDAMFFRRLIVYLCRKLGIFYQRSYAQCGEDLIVRYIFNALNVAHPTYLDIGAHHPYFLSNTYLFYRSGSRGVSIEPDPQLYAKINRCRRRDTNLNVGIGSEAGTLLLHIFDSRTLNTFSVAEAEKYIRDGHQLIEKRQIEVVTFSDVVNRYFDGAPDFVSLDVEGMDIEVLESIDFSRFKPVVFCVETITYSRGGGGVKLSDIDRIMDAHDYIKYADTYINSIYVRRDRWLEQ